MEIYAICQSLIWIGCFHYYHYSYSDYSVTTIFAKKLGCCLFTVLFTVRCTELYCFIYSILGNSKQVLELPRYTQNETYRIGVTEGLSLNSRFRFGPTRSCWTFGVTGGTGTDIGVEVNSRTCLVSMTVSSTQGARCCEGSVTFSVTLG